MAEAQYLKGEKNSYHGHNKLSVLFVNFHFPLPFDASSPPSLISIKNKELILMATYLYKASGSEDPMALYRWFLENLINPHGGSVRKEVLI